MPIHDGLSSVQVSGSIVAYKENYAQIVSAARSFLSSPLNLRLTVVDNSPTDDLREDITATGAEYCFVGRNIGFAAGHNVGIRKHWMTSEYHLVLNPDVEFGPEVLHTLYMFMQENADVGLVVPRVLYPDGSEQHLCKLLPTPFDLVARRFGGGVARTLFQRKMDRYLLKGMDLSKPTVIPCLSGCFMLVRTSLFHTVGLFDERYFLYMEDFDFCRRIGEVSKTMFFPDVAIYHEYKKGSYKSALMLKHHAKSAWQYFWKWGWFFDRTREWLNERTVRPVENSEPLKVAAVRGRSQSDPS
jgi:GT2 family glycosyltransferase